MSQFNTSAKNKPTNKTHTAVQSHSCSPFRALSDLLAALPASCSTWVGGLIRFGHEAALYAGGLRASLRRLDGRRHLRGLGRLAGL